MGIWRFVLALTVVVYHGGGGVQVAGVHIGVAAVVGFYIVSGYAMTGLIDRHFTTDSSVSVRSFYVERLIRLAPQYYFYLAATLVLIFGFDIRSTLFHNGPLTVTTILASLTVVPLSAVTLSQEISAFQIMPQAWSLGTELVFYALFPWLIRSNSRLYLAATASLIISFLAVTGIIQNDGYGFRMFPGVLIYFLAGHFIQRHNWLGLGLIIFGLAINAASAQLFFTFDGWINRSVYAGAAIGIIGVLVTRNLRRNRVDTVLGATSYGIYLSHISVALVLMHYGVVEFPTPPFVVALLILSTLVGLASFWLVERPTIALRERYRVR